jgi:hypothetical protein
VRSEWTGCTSSALLSGGRGRAQWPRKTESCSAGERSGVPRGEMAVNPVRTGPAPTPSFPEIGVQAPQPSPNIGNRIEWFGSPVQRDA